METRDRVVSLRCLEFSGVQRGVIMLSMVLVGLLMSYAITKTQLAFVGFLTIPLLVLLYFRVKWGLYLLAVLVPLQLFPVAYLPGLAGLPYNSSIAHLLVMAILVVTLGRVLIRGLGEIRSHRLDLLVLAYVSCFFLSSSMTDDPNVLFRDVIPFMFALVASYYALVLNVTDTETLKRFVLLLLFSCSGVAAFAGFQYVQGNEAYLAFMNSREAVLFAGPYQVAVRQGWIQLVASLPYTRVGSIFMNPEQLGGFLIFPFFVTLSLAFSGSLPRMRILYGALTIVCGLALVGSVTRSAWLGVGCGIAVLVILSRRHAVGLVLLLAALAIVGLVVANYWHIDIAPSGVQARVPELLAPGFSIQQSPRYQIWLASLETTQRSWLVGYGTRAESHSLYLSILLQTGVLGLAAFSLLMVATLYQLSTVVRAAKDPFQHGLALGLLPALIGWLAHSFFYTDLILNNGMLLFTCLALAAILRRQAAGVDASDRAVPGLPAMRLSAGLGDLVAIFFVVLAGSALAVALASLELGPLDLVSYVAIASVGLLTVTRFVAGPRAKGFSGEAMSGREVDV